MAIVGVNSLLNQYVPTFYIRDIVDGQTLVYDAVRKAFINSNAGGGGATRLGELTDVSPSVDNPLSVQDGQALVYNSSTHLWENTFVDYNTLLNKPTNSDYSFAGLSDTAKPALPNGYVLWNSSGTQLIYSTTIPASSITGLVAVTSVDVSGGSTGLTTSGGPITSSGVITLGGTLSISHGGTGSTTASGALSNLGAVSKYGDTMLGNLSFGGNYTTTNLLEPVNGSDAATKNYVDNAISGLKWKEAVVALATTDVPLSGSGLVIDGITIQDNERVLLINQTIDSENGIYIATLGSGSPATYTLSRSPDANAYQELIGAAVFVLDGIQYAGTAWVQTNYNLTSFSGQIWVQFSGGGAYSAGTGINITGNVISNVGVLSLTGGTNISVSGSSGDVTIDFSGTLPVSSGGTGATNATDAINNLLPTQTGNVGYVLTTNGTTISWQPSGSGPGTITLEGDVTGSGTGTITTTLKTVNNTPGTYGNAHYVPTIDVNAKGLVTSITTQHVDTTVRDLVPEVETIVIDVRHQYIVTGTMEVLGRMENNGRIAIL